MKPRAPDSHGAVSVSGEVKIELPILFSIEVSSTYIPDTSLTRLAQISCKQVMCWENKTSVVSQVLGVSRKKETCGTDESS